MNEFWTGSVTTHTGRNPSFRVLEIDAETKLPTDMKTYFFNITKANEDQMPMWEEMWDFVKDYELEDMSPKSVFDLGERAYHDEELAKTINLNYVAYGPDTIESFSPDQSYCDEKCRLKIKCKHQNGNYYEQKDCMGEPRKDWINDPVGTLFETLLGGVWFTEIDEEI